jgi:hypothetical protein
MVSICALQFEFRSHALSHWQERNNGGGGRGWWWDINQIQDKALQERRKPRFWALPFLVFLLNFRFPANSNTRLWPRNEPVQNFHFFAFLYLLEPWRGQEVRTSISELARCSGSLTWPLRQRLRQPGAAG